METRKKILRVRITPMDWLFLKKVAKRLGVPTSSYARSIIVQHLERESYDTWP